MYERIIVDPANVKAFEAAIVKDIRRGGTAGVMLLREMAERIEGKVTKRVEVEVTGLAERLKRARERAHRSQPAH